MSIYVLYPYRSCQLPSGRTERNLEIWEMIKLVLIYKQQRSVQCLYKGTAYETGKAKQLPFPQPETSGPAAKSGKYVPPIMRERQKGSMGANPRGREDTTAIRISNLSEAMTEADLEELVKRIGPHSKMFLARDKNTGLCKGFAYVHLKSRHDAATAAAEWTRLRSSDPKCGMVQAPESSVKYSTRIYGNSSENNICSNKY